MTDAPNRPADVVTLMWNNDDGTVTTHTTDFTTIPKTVITRVFAQVDPDLLQALEDSSILIPDEVDL